MKYFSFLMCGQVCLGDDGGVRPERQHGGVRRHGQHAHHLRPQQQGRPGQVLISAANRLIGEVVQSRRRPLLGPSPG